MPRASRRCPRRPDPVTNATGAEPFSLTRPSPWLRGYLVRNYPLRKLLPDREPAYVSSVLYTMGVLTLAALIVAVISGAIIALGGVSFWHTNSFGAFMNSIHFWSVQAMFLFMAVHFITNFFTMGWRGGRGWTWITGVLAFILSILTSFPTARPSKPFEPGKLNRGPHRDLFPASGRPFTAPRPRHRLILVLAVSEIYICSFILAKYFRKR